MFEILEYSNKIKELYIILKEKYYDITNEDDYLLCTLWVINNIHAETVDDFIENRWKYGNEFVGLNEEERDMKQWERFYNQ